MSEAGYGADPPVAPARARRVRFAQAWIELRAGDPEAVSAFEVARRLPAGRGLARLRRLRVLELRGALPTRPRLERLLHASIQFYNPHKERCTVRTQVREAPPAAGDLVAVVTERGEERRHAAERWWLHETGDRIEVREGTVWVLEGAGDLLELVTVRDRQHGLLCNPQSQDARTAGGKLKLPLPWISPAAEPAAPVDSPNDEERR